jgi:hypothetical protein
VCLAQSEKDVQLLTQQAKTGASAVSFIKDAITNAESGMAFNLKGEKLAAFYVPLRTLDVPWPNIVDGGAGAISGGGTPEGAVAVRLNLPQIANGIFGTSWFMKNSHGVELPTIFLGPMFKTEWPMNKWTWQKDAFLEVGIPFNDVFK